MALPHHNMGKKLWGETLRADVATAHSYKQFKAPPDPCCYIVQQVEAYCIYLPAVFYVHSAADKLLRL